ncbi:hypothetical protein [Dechloromonas sp. HYN0024]|uniref:hypothetical protein n=1 Tax=Dechloromonas sp. HYN0024 TaxID=2231055 RepID=UPI000E432F91|nr:hypothetical protein [Dechloromonas sp. HYN0024]AXS80160.1 hypothetical protein HYN24_09080 [Dechloromonas sp. HYN0024]
MRNLTAYSLALRFLLIGILLFTCLLFYLRKWESSPPPFSPSAATALCASTPGCKSISTKWEYDIAQARMFVVLRATLARKAANTNALETIQQAIDQHQGELSWMRQMLWPAPRLESRYE